MTMRKDLEISMDPEDPFATHSLNGCKFSTNDNDIMMDILVTVQYREVGLKIMEDGGMTIAGTLISTSNTILHSMDSYALLALGTIPGG